jgi:phage gp29-like protein
MPDDSGPRGLYRPDGSFQPFDAESLTSELATRQTAGEIFSFAAGGLGLLPDPDPVLRARGDDAAVLADLAADDQVTTGMLNRQNRVLNRRDYAFAAGADGKDEADGPARALCERLLRDGENWTYTDILAGALEAPFYGYTPLELIWRPEGGWWRLADIIARPPEWFGFDEDSRPVWRGASGYAPAPLPPGKFVFIRHFPSYKNPYGLRLLARCLWPVAFKKGGIQFYVNFVEKYGQPWTIGTAPAKASRQEKRDMADDLARMVQDAVAVIPAGAKVELVAPQGQQGAVHETFLRRWDAAISKVLQGQTLTTELDGKGSYAAANTHMEVADDLADADRRLVESGFNEIAWIYGKINAPAARCPIFKYAEKKDLKQQAELDGTLTGKLGVRFTPAHMERVYGLEPEEFYMAEPPVSENTVAGQGAYSPGFAEAPAPKKAKSGKRPLAAKAQVKLEEAIGAMLPEALKANDKFLAKLEEAVENANSFDELELALAGLLSPSFTPGAFESLLARAMTAAAGFGATAVHGESEEA